MTQARLSLPVLAVFALCLASPGAVAQNEPLEIQDDVARPIEAQPMPSENFTDFTGRGPTLLTPLSGKPTGGSSGGSVSKDCGNGNPQLGEECDDGNVIDGDGCSAACLIERCGDGAVNNKGTEQCDDGNRADGDGCSGTCQAEKGATPWVPRFRIKDFRPLPMPALVHRLGAKYVIDRVGGPGGSKQVVECDDKIRSNMVVGKIEVRHGGVVDQLTSITCVDPFLSKASVRHDVSAGGGGGASGESSADEGKALIGWEVTNGWWNGMSLVKELVPYQRTVVPEIKHSEVTSTGDRFGPGDGTAKRFPVLCPPGFVMTGVIAAGGGYLDATGIVCREVLSEGTALDFHKQYPAGSEIPLVGYEFGPIAAAHGGYRGEAFRVECSNRGDFVSGMDIGHGGVIDGVKNVYCRPAPASFDPSPAEYVAGGFGGPGGTPGSTHAPEGYAMVGWMSKASHPCTNGGLFDTATGECEGSLYEMTVSEFRALYWPTSGGAAGVNVGEKFGQGSGWFEWGNHVCPSGMFLAGFKGRADQYVRALGGICRLPVARGLIFPVETLEGD